MTDPELHRPPLGIVEQGLLQFGAEGEHLVGVLHGQAARRCQLEGAAIPGEQLGVEAVFQKADLPADGLGRDVERLASLHNATAARRLPEIEKVFEVHSTAPASTCNSSNISKQYFS